MFTTVLFDLDGTLTDPGVGISRSVTHALAVVGAPPLSREQLRLFVGPPLQDGFAQLAGLRGPAVAAAVAAYRDYFSDRGIFENTVYDGIVDALDSLVRAGMTLGLATSKPTVFALRILEHFSLSRFFTCVGGAELDGSRRAKVDVIGHVLRTLPVGPDRGAEVVMVGDREHDVLGAAGHGIRCVGVTWGYGSEAELRAAGASMLVDDPRQLVGAIAAAGSRAVVGSSAGDEPDR